MSSAEMYQRLADLNQAAALMARHGIPDERIEYALGTFEASRPDEYLPIFRASYQGRTAAFFGWIEGSMHLPYWCRNIVPVIEWIESKPAYGELFQSTTPPELLIVCEKRNENVDFNDTSNIIDPMQDIPFSWLVPLLISSLALAGI